MRKINKKTVIITLCLLVIGIIPLGIGIVLSSNRDTSKLVLTKISDFSLEDKSERALNSNFTYPISVPSNDEGKVYFLDPKSSKLIYIDKESQKYIGVYNLSEFLAGGIATSGFYNHESKTLTLAVLVKGSSEVKVINLESGTVINSQIIEVDMLLSFLKEDLIIGYGSNEKYYIATGRDFSFIQLSKQDKDVTNCRFSLDGNNYCIKSLSVGVVLGGQQDSMNVGVIISDNKIVPNGKSKPCYQLNSSNWRKDLDWCGDYIGNIKSTEIIFANNQVSAHTSLESKDTIDTTQFPSDYFQSPNRAVRMGDSLVFMYKNGLGNYSLYKFEIL